ALAAVRYQESRDVADYIFNDTMTALSQGGGGVNVTFEKTAPRRFDLVIGADGLHSATRRLAFGPESEFVHHQGIYVATMQLNAPAEDTRAVVIHNAPGRMVAIHPVRGHAMAAFIFRHPAVVGIGHGDIEQHKRLITDVYA